MDPVDINYQLKKSGLSQAALARKLKITRQVVCMVINGQKESKRVKKTIAKVLGLEIKDIWPDAA